MSWWIWALIALACFVVWAYFAGKEFERRERKIKADMEAYRRDQERTREMQARYAQQRESERLARLEAARLYGEVGESIDEAATRLGVVFKAKGRYLREDGWFGRRGNDAYQGVLIDQRPVFNVLPFDDDMRVGWTGTLTDALSQLGWKLVEYTTEDKPYNCQYDDSDTFYQCVIAVDRLGRVMKLKDNGYATWERDWDAPAGARHGQWKE